MMTVLILAGGAWMLVALIFCLAFAKAASRPMPRRTAALTLPNSDAQPQPVDDPGSIPSDRPAPSAAAKQVAA